jgi:hypothetical protein
LSNAVIQDLRKLNRFIIRVGRIHIGYKELTSSSSMDYRKAGLALIERGVSETLCSMDLDLITSDLLDQVEVFFCHLDQYIIDDIEFWYLRTDAVPDQAVDLPAEVLVSLNDFLLAADAQAHRLEGTNGYYA